MVQVLEFLPPEPGAVDFLVVKTSVSKHRAESVIPTDAEGSCPVFRAQGRILAKPRMCGDARFGAQRAADGARSLDCARKKYELRSG
jgi:hypothetical protein